MKTLIIGAQTGGIGDEVMSHPALTGKKFAPRLEELDVRDQLSVQFYIAQNGPFDQIVYSAGVSQLQWIKDADAAAGLGFETEERDDIYLLLEEITHVARQPSLLPEMEPWHTW